MFVKVYIDDLPNLTGLISLPTFYAAKTLLGNAGLVFLGIAVLAAILLGICGFYMATSRLLYSMAKEGVVEKYIVQHHKMNELSPTAVNTIRFATIYSEHGTVNKEGKKMDIAYAVQKMGGKDSVVDNLHQGGVAALIDVETGKICTDGIDMHGVIQKVHPVTGTPLKGFEIPYFKEAKEMIFKMMKEFDMYGYLGWDVCIEEDGPTVVEVNGRPGVNLPTHTLVVTEGRGIKEHMRQYL